MACTGTGMIITVITAAVTEVLTVKLSHVEMIGVIVIVNVIPADIIAGVESLDSNLLR